jgi:hypothetical protein
MRAKAFGWNPATSPEKKRWSKAANGFAQWQVDHNGKAIITSDKTSRQFDAAFVVAFPLAI